MSSSDLTCAMPSATDALTPHVTIALCRGNVAYSSLTSARVICCGDSRVGLESWCILAVLVLIIELDGNDDNIIVGDEKATVANLAAGAAMNAARSVLINDKDLMIDVD